LSPLLQYILGFEKSDLIFGDDDTISAAYPPDLRAGVDSLFVYCDIVEPQIVGARREQLLRIIPIKGAYAEIVHHDFISPHYVPVLNKQFGSIDISIKTDQNMPVAFRFGKTVAKLHFRKKRTLRI
jgi:hypothetical protein